jgi:chromosome partitioning protein
MGDCQPHEAVRPTAFANVDLLPGDQSLAGIEVELVSAQRRESRLRGALAPLREKYDYIFIDCPPSIGLLSLNALCAADTVIIPIQCEFFALEGLSQVMGSLREAKRLYNPTLDIEGVLLTMFDGRLNQTQQVVHEIKRFFPRKLFSATIPRSVRLSEAPSFGQPIQYYDPSSRGAAAYRAVAEELVGTVRR